MMEQTLLALLVSSTETLVDQVEIRPFSRLFKVRKS